MDDMHSAMQKIYRMRLSLEAYVNSHDVYHLLDKAKFEKDCDTLDQVIYACGDEEEYQKWKQSYTYNEMCNLKGTKIVVCLFSYPEHGDFEWIISENQIDMFTDWIKNHRGSSFNGVREADEEEIKQYIALNSNNKR